jgi:uncharacterized protein involved in tolerance to divalent cations
MTAATPIAVVTTVGSRKEARAIRELHSYELPAIHAFAFARISAPYAEWIESNSA